MSKQISRYFSLEEASVSGIAARLGIDNTIPESILPAVYNTARCMDTVRVLLNDPIHVDSWYRCIELNRVLKSKDNSKHPLGEAVDFISPTFGEPVEMCRRIVSNKDIIRFDQLILEYTWVHISFCSNPNSVPRNLVLSLLSNGKFANGLTNTSGEPYE